MQAVKFCLSRMRRLIALDFFSRISLQLNKILVIKLHFAQKILDAVLQALWDYSIYIRQLVKFQEIYLLA